MENSFKNLSDPSHLKSLISINGCEIDSLIKMLHTMLLIRKAEEKLAFGRKNGFIGGPVHLGTGQEAVAVGVSTHLKKTDRVFGAHRSHSHLLALNPDVHKLFAEILGKDTGFSRGMGGSMHLWDQTNGFYGSVPIVTGTVPLAVGASLAAKMNHTNDIGCVYLGDGAAEEGVFHESLNLAKVLNAPCLFVVENNLFASHMHISLRQPSNSVTRFATANHIPFKLVDGNDVVAVANAAQQLIGDMRSGKGPMMLELVTYRWYGHVDWRDDIDVGVQRSVDDLNNWKARDPIKRLSDTMINNGLWSKNEEESINNDLDEIIRIAWNKAMNDPFPNNDATLKYVYSKET
ncbi:thiamine pyrophosphate-dependent dehydrogenase E1 component subunit alpha [bacterium]|nr:thiamine pyrophosphate-dependent dehydrogenase E1 component subunit alpha [bacterium]